MSDQNSNTNPEETEEVVGFVKDVEKKTVEEVTVTEEVTTTEEIEPVELGSSQAMSALEIESMIHRNLAEIDKLREQIKTQKEMYDSTVENDAAFAEQSEKEKEVKKATAAIKQKIVKQPAVIEITERMKDLKEEMKEVQDTISGLAEEYERVSGTTQIMKEDGEVLEIVKIYKLQKQKKDE